MTNKSILATLVAAFVLTLCSACATAPELSAVNSSSEPQILMTEPMRLAARGDIESLRKLNASSEQLLKRNSDNANILHFAAQSTSNSVAVFEFVREQVSKEEFERLLSEQINPNGHTVAIEAVFNLNTAVVNYLIKTHKTGVAVNFSSSTVFGWTPRTFADRLNFSIANQIPAEGVKASERMKWLDDEQKKWFDSLTDDQKKSQSAGLELLKAIEAFDLAKIETLVGSGVDLNGRYGRLGATPLNSLTQPQMSKEVLQKVKQVELKLLSLGADPNVSEGRIMKVGAGFRESVSGYTELVQIMIDHLREKPEAKALFLNVRGPLNGYTKLIDASLRGHKDVIQLLLKEGADKTISGYNGMNAYKAALQFNAGSKSKLKADVLKSLKVAE